MSEGFNIDSKIVSGIERISEAIRLALIKKGIKLALSQTQFRLIRFLMQRGPMSQSEIVREFGLDKTTINKSLRSLRKKGFVKIVRDKIDRRSKKVFLIKNFVDLGSISVFQVLEDSTASLSPSQKEIVYLFIYNSILELFKEGFIKYQRMCANCFYGSWRSKKFYCGYLKKFLSVKDFMIDCPDFLPKVDSY